MGLSQKVAGMTGLGTLCVTLRIVGLMRRSVKGLTTSFIPSIFRQAGKVYNNFAGDNFQKIATEFSEYANRNLDESELEYDYDLRGRKYDKFMYFYQFERDSIDE